MDDQDKTPLFWSMMQGHNCTTALLIKTPGVGINFNGRDDTTMLAYAVAGSNVPIAQMLLDTARIEPNSGGWGKTPLIIASEEGDETMVEVLLQSSKVDVNAIDREGKTALWYAVKNGYEDTVRMLLKEDKARASSDMLNMAAMRGYVAGVKLLLEHGQVDVNWRDENGNTPLHHAVTSGGKKVALTLINVKNIDIDMKNGNGQSVFLKATITSDWNSGSNDDAMLRLLLGTGKVDVNASDIDGNTPLTAALRRFDTAYLRLLLETNALNFDLADRKLRMALSNIAENDRREVDVNKMRLMIGTGKIDGVLKDGLFDAVLKGYIDRGDINREGSMVNLLFTAGYIPLSDQAAALEAHTEIID